MSGGLGTRVLIDAAPGAGSVRDEGTQVASKQVPTAGEPEPRRGKPA